MKKLLFLFLFLTTGLFAQTTQLTNLELSSVYPTNALGTARITWKCDFGELRYSNEFFVVEYSRDSSFLENVSRTREYAWSNNGLVLSTEVSGLEKGSWHFRVAFAFGWEVFDIVKGGSDNGFTHHANVNIENGYSQPKLTIPDKLTEQFLVLSWIESTSISRYNIQMSNKADFSVILEDIIVIQSGNGYAEIDFSDYDPGVYILRINGEIRQNVWTDWNQVYIVYDPLIENIHQIAWVSEPVNGSAETYVGISVLNDAQVTEITMTVLPDKVGSAEPDLYVVTLYAYRGEIFMERLQSNFPFDIGGKPVSIAANNPIFVSVFKNVFLYGDSPIHMPYELPSGTARKYIYPPFQYDEFHRPMLVVSNFTLGLNASFTWILHYEENGQIKKIEDTGLAKPYRAWTLDFWEEKHAELPDSFTGWVEIINNSSTDINTELSIKNLPKPGEVIYGLLPGIQVKD